MKKFIQPVILMLGIVAMVYGISKMFRETSTMILPVWMIVGFVSLIVTGASVVVGVLIKGISNVDWHSLTFASLFIVIIVGIYAVVAYKPKIAIIVSSGFSGEVRLIVSKDTVEKDEIVVDSLGIGYITREDFSAGFYPKIKKGNADITNEVKDYSKGAVANSSPMSYTLEYLSFVIPGTTNQANDIHELITNGAIDTLRLPEK